MKMNKKGFIYLVAASVLIVILIVVFLSSQEYKLQDKQELYNIRIQIMNDFVKGFNQDLERAMQISAFRTMVALEDNVATNGKFLNNTEESFRETFYKGTIEGLNTTIMNDSSISDYLLRVNQIASNLGINVNTEVSKINLTQNNPWYITVKMTAEINITDSRNLAYWEYTKEFETDVPIYNLRNPLYSVYTENRVSSSIIVLNETELVSADNDTSNLQKLINESYYIASPNAPSFLMRFENKTTSDPNGIETIVDIQLLSDQDIEVFENRIKVDYIYFNDISGTKVCNVQDIPVEKYFVITTNRVNTYQIENLSFDNSTDCS